MARTSARVKVGARRGKEFAAVVGLVGGLLLLQLVASTIAGVTALRDAETATDAIYRFTADATAERILAFIEPAEYVADEVQWRMENPFDPGAYPPFLPDDFPDDPFFNVPGDPFGDAYGEATIDGLYFLDVRDLLAEDYQLSGVLVSMADGTAWGAARGADGWSEYTAAVGADPQRLRTDFGDQDFPLGTQPWESDRDFRKVPWYRAAVTAKASTWFGLSPSEFGSQPVISVVNPVADASGALLGVIRVELETQDLSAYLSELPLGEGGEAFLLSETRGLIATPTQYLPELRAATEAAGLGDDAPERGLGPGNSGHPATTLGIETPEPGTEGTVVQQGEWLVYEIPLDDDGSPNWTLHLRAAAGGIAPGISSFQHTMLVYSVAIGVLVVLGALVIVFLRGPLARLRERAAHDHLTGLLNRHEFMARGAALVEAAERRGGVAIVAMFDLDNFKAINDAHGHDAGDEALAAAAHALERCAGPRDVIGRFGGDEFALVRWIQGGEVAGREIEQMRAYVAAELQRGRVDDIEVGASAGFALSGAGINELGALLSAADEALVTGKNAHKGATHSAS